MFSLSICLYRSARARGRGCGMNAPNAHTFVAAAPPAPSHTPSMSCSFLPRKARCWNVGGGLLSMSARTLASRCKCSECIFASHLRAMSLLAGGRGPREGWCMARQRRKRLVAPGPPTHPLTPLCCCSQRPLPALLASRCTQGPTQVSVSTASDERLQRMFGSQVVHRHGRRV